MSDAAVEQAYYDAVVPAIKDLSGSQIDELIHKMLAYRMTAENSPARQMVAEGMVLTGWTRHNRLLAKTHKPNKRIQGQQPQKQHSRSPFDPNEAYTLRVKRIDLMLAGRKFGHFAPPTPAPGDVPKSRATGNSIVFF